MEWIKLRSDEFPAAVEKAKGVCVIPVGCVEAHGIHLPLGCDSMKGRDYCVMAAEKSPVIVFPEMYFGEKSGAGEFPGTIVFPTTLIWDILEQSCNEIARNGLNKILLVSSHGGNAAMLQAFARYMLQKHHDYVVYYYYQKLPLVSTLIEKKDTYSYLTDEDMAILEDYVAKKKVDGHGGFVETGMMYDLYPDLTRLDLIDARDPSSTGRFDEFTKNNIFTGLIWMANRPHSYDCDIHYGMNERIARAISEETVSNTADAFDFLRNETVSMEYHKEWLAKQKRVN